MNRCSSPTVTRYLVTALVALALFARPAAADTTKLQLSPQIIEVGGVKTRVEVSLDGVSELYGLDIRLEFDPTLLEIVDADGGKDGVQIIAGQIPAPDFSVRNEADNASGTLWYAVTQMNPREPASGAGVVLAFEVRGLTAGSGQITIVDAKLVDRAGQALPVETIGGDVTVSLEAAPAAQHTPRPTITATPGPTRTSAPTATALPTDSPEPEEAEPTATTEPEGPDPTATGAPTATPTTPPDSTVTPRSGISPPAERTAPEREASPEATASPTGTHDAPSDQPASPTAPAALALAEPSPTFSPTPAPVAAPAHAAFSAADPGERAAPPEPEVRPLIPAGLFSCLLGLVALAALALSAHLIREDSGAARVQQRKTP